MHRRLLFAALAVLLLAACSSPGEVREVTRIVEVTKLVEVTKIVQAEAEPCPTCAPTSAPPTVAPEPTAAPVAELATVAIGESQDKGGVVLEVVSLSYGTPAEYAATLDGFDKAMFESNEDVTSAQSVIVLHVRVTNGTDGVISVYPDQGVFTIGNEQIDAAIFLSGDVGGDLEPDIMKEGDVLCLVQRTAPADLSSVRYLVNAPHNADFENLADSGYEFTLQVK